MPADRPASCEAVVLNKRTVDAIADASGDAAARLVGLPHDVLTLAHSARATAPDGRSFADIRQTEGVAGIKRAQEAQYSSGWLRARMARFQIALLQTTASG